MNGTIFTLRNLYRDGTICLEKAGIPDAKLDAWYLLEYETKISRAMFLADPDKEDHSILWLLFPERNR